MTENEILDVLHGVQHPELQSDIVSLGMVDGVRIDEEGIRITIVFARARDPFAQAIRKRSEEAVASRYPQYAGKISVFVKEAPPKKKNEKQTVPLGADDRIRRIVAVSSAKGGVGKSTLTANLAVALAKAGYRTGVLDADIYGPSQPMMFGVEDYRPEGENIEGKEWIVPAEAYGVKVMSIGFFIPPGDALMWRGPMATNALRQMIHQTLWGPLDFLLLDLPPGTGDVHLSVISEMKVDGALIVTTPQRVALADVVRGVHMFRNEKVNIPILGLVENMAWFTPAELPDNRYYIFGEGEAARIAEQEKLPLLASIPLIRSVSEAADSGRPVTSENLPDGKFYDLLAEGVVAELILFRPPKVGRSGEKNIEENFSEKQGKSVPFSGQLIESRNTIIRPFRQRVRSVDKYCLHLSIER